MVWTSTQAQAITGVAMSTVRRVRSDIASFYLCNCNIGELILSQPMPEKIVKWRA